MGRFEESRRGRGGREGGKKEDGVWNGRKLDGLDKYQESIREEDVKGMRLL